MDFGGYADKYGDLENFLNKSFWNYVYVKFPIMFGILLVILYPLCLSKDISKLTLPSFLGCLTLLILIIIIAVESPWYMTDYWNNKYKKYDSSTHLHMFNISIGFEPFTFNFFRGMATIFYAYCCHYAAFPIFKLLEDRTEKRIQKVVKTTLTFDLFLYLTIGITGYLSNPINTPPLIIERYKLLSNDIIIAIGRLLFVMTVTVKIPTAYNSFRLSLIELVCNSTEVTPFR